MAIVDTHFGRGVGLGNRLFPWARSRVFAYENRLECLAPNWAHLRRGALFKGGVDYRHFARKIWLFENFCPNRHDMQGIKKWFLRWSTIPIEESLVTSEIVNSSYHRIIFSGDGNHFRDLHPYQPFIHDTLYGCILPKWQTFLKHFDGADIGLNVRLGRDFQKASVPGDFLTKGGLLTPVEWFCQALTTIRKMTGRECSAVIISDGTQQQLQPLLAMGNVTFFQTPAAVTDLFALSKVKVLIGSGGSSFSAWASFLGKVPVLAIPGQSFSWFGLHEQNEYLVDVLDIENPSDMVQSTLTSLLASNS